MVVVADEDADEAGGAVVGAMRPATVSSLDAYDAGRGVRGASLLVFGDAAGIAGFSWSGRETTGVSRAGATASDVALGAGVRADCAGDCDVACAGGDVCADVTVDGTSATFGPTSAPIRRHGPGGIAPPLAPLLRRVDGACCVVLPRRCDPPRPVRPRPRVVAPASLVVLAPAAIAIAPTLSASSSMAMVCAIRCAKESLKKMIEISNNHGTSNSPS